MGWALCFCFLPRAPAASPLLLLALGELLPGATPLESSSASLARSFSADLAKCVGSGTQTEEEADMWEQAGPCDQDWAGSWVTPLVVAAHGWVGLGISIL